MPKNQGKVPEMVENASAFMCGLHQSLEFRIELGLRWKEYCLILMLSINIKLASNIHAEMLSSKSMSSIEFILCTEKSLY